MIKDKGTDVYRERRIGIYGSEIYERKKILPSIVIYKVQVRNS